MNDALAKLTAATTMLAQAKTLDEVKPIIDLASAAATYARAAKLGQEAVNHAAEMKLRAERKAGELLSELERGQGQGNQYTASFQTGTKHFSEYATVLTENDIAPVTAHRWQSVAEVPEPVFNQYIDVIKTRNDELTRSGLLRAASSPHVANNSGNNEWYTPAEYANAARRVMDGIDLDPASSQEANEVIGAEQFFSIDDDGLEQHWYGRVWLNPPYSSDLIGAFVAKLVRHKRAGDVTEAIVLVNNATETAWFRGIVSIACAVVFPSGRVRFWQPGGTLGAPLQGQAIIYCGQSAEWFLQVFREFGWGARIE